jgi:hypothetical protein
MKILLLFLLLALASVTVMAKDSLEIKHTKDFGIEDLAAYEWDKTTDVTVTKYWSGESAPESRTFHTRLLWSDNALYVRFEANQNEPLVVSDKPDLSKKAHGLWERDVCEIFIARDPKHQNRYFEFEIAPTGEWIDIGIEVTPKERLSDWDYRSGMTSAVRIDKDKVVMAIKIPFASLGKTPKAGDVWLGNVFRCVGKGATRGYLAWQPTKTEMPSFHVPSAFAEFRFIK